MTDPKTEKTHLAYVTCAKQLCARAIKARGHKAPFAIAMPDVAEFALTIKPTVARSTWRLYKASLIHYSQWLADSTDDPYVGEDARRVVDILSGDTEDQPLRKGVRAPALKSKTFKQDDFDRVIAYVRAHYDKHKFARLLDLWLRASRLTGLRPSEWEWADLIEVEGEPALRVKNGKATHGRGNGETRTLILEQLTEEEVDSIRELNEMIVGYVTEIPFDKLQNLLRLYLRRVGRACLGKRPKYPCLYSLRHQFAADAKLSGASKQEVAAMLGHASDATAGKHYARRVSGESGLRVSPVQQEVQTVRLRSKTFTPADKTGG